MKLPFQDEVLLLLKQKLLPEIEQIKVEQQKFSIAQTQMQADIKVIDGRLDQIDKRFEQVDKRFEQVDKRFEQVDKRFEQIGEQMHDMKDELREVRSYVFSSYIAEKVSAVREKAPGYSAGRKTDRSEVRPKKNHG